MVKNSLQAAIKNIDTAAPITPPPPERSKATPRSDTVMIGGHFPRKVNQQLRMIAVEEMTTNQALLEEALDLLFVKKGKEKIRNL